MMSVLHAKAKEVSTTLTVDPVAESPFLDWLKEIFTQLLPLLIGCLPLAQRNPEGLAKALNTPNLRQRLGLRFWLRRNIDDPRTGNLGVSEIQEALHAMGKGCNEADAEGMLSEVA
jgi:hypothetical protein